MKKGRIVIVAYFLIKGGMLLGVLSSSTEPFCHHKSFSLFGYPLNSPIGLAACPLTSSSEAIARASQQGYNVITYKTIRSKEHPVFSDKLYPVAASRPLTQADSGKKYYVNEKAELSPYSSFTNAIGICSASPQETTKDIARARAALQLGQILIVSVYGTGETLEEQSKDYGAAAQSAFEGGAHVLEANLSCPNVAQIPLYQQPEAVYSVCKALTTAFPTLPLMIKVGIFNNRASLKQTLIAASQGGAQGVCGINTVPIQAIDQADNPIFGKERIVSGLSGHAIKNLALQFVRNARSIIDEENLNLVLIGTGGITQPHEFDEFLRSGADSALCATGAMLDENLAQNYHQLHKTTME